MFASYSRVHTACLLANLGVIPFDYTARQKVGGVNLKYFTMKQLPVLPPSAYTADDLLFIVPRVLELAYTAWDIKAFADDVWREADEALRTAIRAQWDQNADQTGRHQWQPPDWLQAYPEIAVEPDRGIPLPPFKWDETRRAWLRAELDAYYARLYGLTRKQLRYILDPSDLTKRELEDILDPWEEIADPLEGDSKLSQSERQGDGKLSQSDPTASPLIGVRRLASAFQSDSKLSHSGYSKRAAESDFPGETFRVLKEKELRQYGEYRTRRLVLEAWSRFGSA